jgi:hypothetical protein
VFPAKFRNGLRLHIYQVKSQKFTIANLAAMLRGKKIACAFLTSYLKTKDFESCQAFIQFDDNTIIELGLVEMESIEYPASELKLQKLERVEWVEKFSIRGLVVHGLYFSESVFSIGIVVNIPPLGVLCLDATVLMRMQLHLYPLNSIDYHNGRIF